MEKLFIKAFEIAVRAHQGQSDKSGIPYICHPVTVASRCPTIEERIVALLHDVVEDTDVTLKYLFDAGFPSIIVQAVNAITHRKGESNTDYIKRCSENIIAAKVKIKDIEHNMERMNYLTDPVLVERLTKKYAKASEILKMPV